MGVVTELGASESAVDRTRLGIEVAIVLGLSLGQSAVYAVLRIIERLTREVPLAQQTSTLNPSVTPDRPWLDLTYQLVGIAFGLMPVLLALYLLNLTTHAQIHTPGSGCRLWASTRAFRMDHATARIRRTHRTDGTTGICRGRAVLWPAA